MNDVFPDFSAALGPWLPEAGQPLAVAVSGGPDSMALCHMLAHCATGPVHALTVDHGLRAEAAEEAARVGAWLVDWPHIRHEILTRKIADKPCSKIQEKAREDRYALLAQACARHGAERLFVAHHRNDQAETFLFRLAKGSGLDGLAGMRPLYRYSEKLAVIRPLLDVPGKDLLSYCQKNGLPFIQDPSNANPVFARVRLRQAESILAEEGLSPKRLAVTAARLAAAREALDFYAEQTFERSLLEKNPDRIVLDFKSLALHPFETRLRVLTRALALLNDSSAYGARLESVEALTRRLFEEPGFKKASLAKCLIGLDRRASRITVEKEGPSSTQA